MGGGQISYSLYLRQSRLANVFPVNTGLHNNLFRTDSGVGRENVPTFSCALNFDIFGLVTLKRLSSPAGSRKRGCYGKSASRASEETEIQTLASLLHDTGPRHWVSGVAWPGV